MGVTTDSKNRVHIGWGEFGTNDGFIDLRYRSFSNGAWGTVQDVDVDNQDADSPFIYPDKWDNQHFMWSEKNATTGRWEVKYRLAEGTIQTITTAGGTVTANPNNVTEATLTIPSGALNSTQEITIQVGPVPEAVDGGVVTLPKAYTFRPHGLTFISPITATIFYTDTDVQGVDERDLRPWFWNSITNAWESQIGTNRPSQNRIEVSLSHFSLYGISAPKVHTTFIAPLPDQEVKQGSMMYEFGLSYADGTPIKPITNPEDLLVKLRNSDGTVVSIAQFDGKQLIKGTQQGSFKDVLHFQQDNLPSGEYTLEIYLTGSLMGKQTFFLIK